MSQFPSPIDSLAGSLVTLVMQCSILVAQIISANSAYYRLLYTKMLPKKQEIMIKIRAALLACVSNPDTCVFFDKIWVLYCAKNNALYMKARDYYDDGEFTPNQFKLPCDINTELDELVANIVISRGENVEHLEALREFLRGIHHNGTNTDILSYFKGQYLDEDTDLALISNIKSAIFTSMIKEQMHVDIDTLSQLIGQLQQCCYSAIGSLGGSPESLHLTAAIRAKAKYDAGE